MAEKQTLPKSIDKAGTQEPSSSSLSPKKFSSNKANKQRYLTEQKFERGSIAEHGPRRVGGFARPSCNKGNTEIIGGNFESKKYDV